MGEPVVGLSAMIWDSFCSPFSFDGSTVTRKSGASASDDVIWQMMTDACVAGNESLGRLRPAGDPVGSERLLYLMRVEPSGKTDWVSSPLGAELQRESQLAARVSSLVYCC